MDFALGFALVAVPALAVIIIRNRQLSESNRVGIEQKRAEREAQRFASKLYRDYCRANNLLVPLSTDEFYAGTEFENSH